MKDTDTTSPERPRQVPTPGISVTEEELQKIKQQLSQQNQPQKPVSLKEGWGTIKSEDFLSVHKAPCSREGFLTGIGGGAAVGGLRYILGASIPKAANWAVGIGALFAIVRYEVCQVYRREEHAKVKRVVKIQNEKQTQLRKQEEARRAAQKAEEEAAAKAKRWYKFW